MPQSYREASDGVGDSPINWDRLFEAVQRDEPRAKEEFYSKIYEVLHCRAHRKLQAEQNRAGFGTTSLLHDVLQALLRVPVANWKGFPAFMLYASRALHSILVSYIRARKRGPVRLCVDEVIEDLAARTEGDLTEFFEALEKLAAPFPVAHDVIVQRFIMGLAKDTVCEAMGISPSTYDRQLAFGRRVLRKFLRQFDEPSDSTSLKGVDDDETSPGRVERGPQVS